MAKNTRNNHKYVKRRMGIALFEGLAGLVEEAARECLRPPPHKLSEVDGLGRRSTLSNVWLAPHSGTQSGFETVSESLPHHYVVSLYHTCRNARSNE
jgi:hypothetical protein